MDIVNKKVSFINQGDSVYQIFLYWLPELISVMILITLPPIVDSLIVANSQTIASYSVLILATNFLYTFTKFAEAIPVASIAIIGRHNGAGDFDKCGEELGTIFWLTFFLGAIQFLLVSTFSHSIYHWLGVPADIIAYGVSFLRLKSLSIFLTFTLFGFIFFMKAIKNTKIPMLINVIGITIFCFLDYALVLGKYGFPEMNLHGSALASIVQFVVMNALAIGYILLNKEYKKYFKKVFFKSFSTRRMIRVLNLSWPIMVDKSSFAMAYVWLSKMIAPLGTYAIATYDVVKHLERFAFIPAMAFAQIVTFLVSNRLGADDIEGATANIKKILILSTAIVAIMLFVICFQADYFISFFDKTNSFTSFAAFSLVVISPFVAFDVIQLILAGALRGSGDVRTVMWGRSLTCLLFFAPFSYVCSKFDFHETTYSFIAIYSSYYLATGIMSLIFFKRIKSHKWQTKKI